MSGTDPHPVGRTDGGASRGARPVDGTDPIRVVVADDHPVVREGLRSYLGSRPGLAVVGEAADVHDVVALASRERPDVVVLDLVMPGGGGLAALPRLAALDPPPRVLVLTSFGTHDDAIAAVRAGADGWLGKDAPPTELEAAVRTVARGGSVLDPAVAPSVLRSGDPAADDGGAGERAGLDQLTPREREVLAHLGRGLTNRQLARALYLSEKTVKTHLSAIFAKLGVHDRTQAALIALQTGVTDELN